MFFSLEKNLLWRRIYEDYVENFFLALSNFYPSYRHWMYTIELLKKLINHNTVWSFGAKFPYTNDFSSQW